MEGISGCSGGGRAIRALVRLQRALAKERGFLGGWIK